MPAAVARLLPRLRPSGTSPLFLLLLLALLRGRACGRVPHSVPRTSLPISGKARASSPLALGSRPGSRLQAPKPTFALLTRAAAPRAPTARPTASFAARASPEGRRDPHVVPLRPPGRLGSDDTPRRLPLSLIYAAASLSVDADTEARGGEWGLPETVHFQVSSPLFPLSLACTCVRHASLTTILLSNPSISHTPPNTRPSDYQLSLYICPLLRFTPLSSVLTSFKPFVRLTALISLTHFPVLSSLMPTPSLPLSDPP